MDTKQVKIMENQVLGSICAGLGGCYSMLHYATLYSLTVRHLTLDEGLYQEARLVGVGQIQVIQSTVPEK